MADGTTGTVRKDFIEYWFREFTQFRINTVALTALLYRQ